MEPQFSDQEEIQAPKWNRLPLPTRTSAPLLYNSSLTDNLSNFPLINSRAGSSVGPEPSLENEPQQETNRKGRVQDPNPGQIPTPRSTSNRRGQPRGRPSRKRRNSTSSSRTTVSSRGPTTRSRSGRRFRARARAPSRTLERALTLPNI